MDHDEPVLPVNINGNVFVGNFPKKTFIVTSVFRLIYSKSEIIATVSREAFFALVRIISSTFCFSHGSTLRWFRKYGFDNRNRGLFCLPKFKESTQGYILINYLLFFRDRSQNRFYFKKGLPFLGFNW